MPGTLHTVLPSYAYPSQLPTYTSNPRRTRYYGTGSYALYARLAEEKTPTVLHILPQTDDGFDLVVRKLAPAAHNAIYDVERFLAIIAAVKEITKNEQAATTHLQQVRP